MRYGWLAVGIVALALGCGGSRGSSKSAASGPDSGGGGESGLMQKNASGVPDWVNRGSLALNNNGERAFYGVGLASGIKNPSLLRQTADNRARNELAKLLETFSASLMKDYMNSSGEQNVENAIKTAASASLRGAEVVDRYVAADGTMYALAKLDLEKAAKMIAQAEELGAARSHVKKVSVDDIFDQHGKKAAPKPPVKVAARETDDSPKQSTTSSSAKTKSGAKPMWVDGSDPNYPEREYLCAVGYSTERSAAENAGFSALSRIFEAHVQSVSKDFMGAYAKTGAQSVEVQSSEQLTKVATEKVFSGVEIEEVWQAPDKEFYALACLNRARAAANLREAIRKHDEAAKRHLEASAAADKAGRVEKLGRVMDELVAREALNSELRIVAANGVGVASPYAPWDVAAAFEAAVEALKVGVLAEGPYSQDFRGTLIEALTRRGFEVSDYGAGGQYDVTVSANIRMEDGGKGTGSARSMHFARGVINVEVKNVAQSKVMGSFRESRKEGHRNKDEAERRVVRKLAKKVSAKIGKKIEDAMKGRG